MLGACMFYLDIGGLRVLYTGRGRTLLHFSPRPEPSLSLKQHKKCSPYAKKWTVVHSCVLGLTGPSSLVHFLAHPEPF